MASRTSQYLAWVSERFFAFVLLVSAVGCTAVTASAAFYAHVPIGKSLPDLMFFAVAAASIDVLGGTKMGFVATVLLRIGRPVSGVVLGTLALICMAYSALSLYALLSFSTQGTAAAETFAWIAEDLALEPEHVRKLYLLLLAASVMTVKVVCLAFGIWLWPRAPQHIAVGLPGRTVDHNAVPVAVAAGRVDASPVAEVRLPPGTDLSEATEAMPDEVPQCCEALLSDGEGNFCSSHTGSAGLVPNSASSAVGTAQRGCQHRLTALTTPRACLDKESTEDLQIQVVMVPPVSRHDDHYRGARGPPAAALSLVSTQASELA